MWKSLVCCATSLLALTSCEEYINEDYDLSKDIDMTVSALPGLTVPVGNVSKVTVADILDLDLTDKGLVYPDDNGDFVVEYAHNGQKLEVNVPDLGIGSSLLNKDIFDPISIDFPVSSAYYPGISSVGFNLYYSDLTGAPLSLTTSMDFDVEFPSEVKDVKCIEFQPLAVLMDVRTSLDRIYMKSGFKIRFPEYIYLEEYYTDLEIEDEHTLVINDNKIVPAFLQFSIARIDVPEGAYSNGRLVLNPEIEIEGDFYVNTAEIADFTNDHQITISASISKVEVDGAELMFDGEYELDDIEVEIEGIPDFLTAEDAVLDIYNPSLYMSVENPFNFQFGLQAELTSYHKGGHSASVSLGKDPEIVIEKNSQPWYVISRREMELYEGFVNIVDPALGDMFCRVPEKFTVNDIKVKVGSADEYQWYDLYYNSYTLPYYFRLNLPLAFGENLNFSYDYDVDVANIKFSAMIEQATMTLDLINSIPLAFDLDVEAIDYNGNTVEGVNFDIDAKIASGTHDSPVTTPVTLSLSTTEKSISLGGIRMKLRASAPSAEHVGVVLNKNQGIELKGISLSVPSGVTINPENL